jgi:diaminopimelate decarboxylase
MLGHDAYERLADRWGTPLYVVSEQRIEENVRILRDALPSARIHYAIKANPALAVIEHLQGLGCGAECVTETELQLVEQLGFRGEAVILNGGGKARSEVERALSLGATVNVDDLEDLDLVERVARARSITVGVRLRLRIADLITTAELAARGPVADFYRFKWGMPEERLREACRRASESPHLRIAGLSFHLSQVSAPSAYDSAVYHAVEIASALRGAGLARLDELDVGGGFGSDVAPEEYAEALTEGLDRAEVRFAIRPARLIVEPGRFLVGSAGVLVTRGTAVKQADDLATRFVLVDASFTHLLMKTLNPSAPQLLAPEGRGPAHPTHVSGATCSPDVLAISAPLPPVVAGDLLVFLDAGAYADALSASYNSIPRPPTVMVGSGSAPERVISRRESLADLLRRQPPK